MLVTELKFFLNYFLTSKGHLSAIAIILFHHAKCEGIMAPIIKCSWLIFFLNSSKNAEYTRHDTKVVPILCATFSSHLPAHAKPHRLNFKIFCNLPCWYSIHHNWVIAEWGTHFWREKKKINKNFNIIIFKLRLNFLTATGNYEFEKKKISLHEFKFHHGNWFYVCTYTKCWRNAIKSALFFLKKIKTN